MNQEELLKEFEIPTYEAWKEAAIVALKGVPFEKKLITQTYEGIDLQPIYNKSDRDKVGYVAESLPGSFPFVRGNCSSGYKHHSWDISQEIGYPLPKAFNEAARYDLERGQDALTIRVCNCRTLFGSCKCKVSTDEKYTANADIENTICPAVHITDLKDMEDALNGIDLTKTPIYFLTTCPAPYSFELATLFCSYCLKHGINPSEVKVNFGFDFISQLARQGKLDNPIDYMLNEVAAIMRMVSGNSPKSNTISVDGTVYHNSGANATQEIAYSIATAVFYIREMLNRGLDINTVAKNIHFNLSVGVKFFIEISKLRAAKVVWAKIVKEFGGDEDAQKMRVHAFTSRIDKTKFDPYVNMLRGTTEGLAAALAGVSSLHVSTFDEEIGLASSFSRRIARNIQSILKEEAHILDTIDPAGGSYYIETLTDQFVTAIWDIFRNVEKEGGILAALKNESIQNAIAAIVAKRENNIALRKDTILGTNKYPNLAEQPVDNLTTFTHAEIDAHVREAEARKKAVSYREITEAFLSDKNKADEMIAKGNVAAELMMKAYQEGASMMDLFKSKPQEKMEIRPIPAFRMAAAFERLREAAIAYKAKNGKAPELYFANFGTLKQYKGRADFSTDFFAVGGFNIRQGAGYANAEDGIKDIANIAAPAVVICSMDDIYPEVVPSFVQELKKQQPHVKVILAGLPTEHVEAFKAAGVDEFIHIKSNVYETVSGLMKNLGVL